MRVFDCCLEKSVAVTSSLKKKKKAKIQMVNFYEESSNCGSQGEC